MNSNPYLSQFLMFYSQSDEGNGLTRGLESDIAQRTYVPTKMDETLTPAILKGQFRLVILTGNAGDGKTAFIQKVEQKAREMGASLVSENGLGSVFQLNETTFRTLYDGSLDVDGLSNQQMLEQYFEPFKGTTAPTGSSCLLIAMNEGKLRDFLSHTPRHRWLSETLLGHVLRGAELPDDVVVVNLNLRSVVDAQLDSNSSLFDRILDRYVAPEFWEACESCTASEKCPVRFNVTTFQIPSVQGQSESDKALLDERAKSANIARTRLKAVFQILHFRKRIHVTVRDLRSVLAYTLFGKRTCDQIVAEVREGETRFLNRYYFNAVFDASEKDRVLQFIAEFDPGRSSSPQTDAELSFARPGTGEFRSRFLDFAASSHPTNRSRIDEDALLVLYERRPASPEERTPEARQAAQRYVESLRRKLFFEGPVQGDAGNPRMIRDDLMPFDNLQEYMEFAAGDDRSDGRLKQNITLGISRSEGMYDETRGAENICIRTRHDGSPSVKAFYTYAASHFALKTPPALNQAQYVEYLPATLLFEHIQRGTTLDISLDLYEMLMRIREGYVPTAGEMRTFFLNLLMFKKQLMSLPTDRLLLTDTDYQFFELVRTPSNGVELKTA
jgi:hypothetical protein